MRLKKDKSGDTVGRPSWRSSLSGDPGAKFFCGKPQHMKNSLNFANTCLKVIDTRRLGKLVIYFKNAGFGGFLRFLHQLNWTIKENEKTLLIHLVSLCDAARLPRTILASDRHFYEDERGCHCSFRILCGRRPWSL